MAHINKFEFLLFLNDVYFTFFILGAKIISFIEFSCFCCQSINYGSQETRIMNRNLLENREYFYFLYLGSGIFRRRLISGLIYIGKIAKQVNADRLLIKEKKEIVIDSKAFLSFSICIFGPKHYEFPI